MLATKIILYKNDGYHEMACENRFGGLGIGRISYCFPDKGLVDYIYQGNNLKLRWNNIFNLQRYLADGMLIPHLQQSLFVKAL